MAVVGPPGSGKATLLKLINRLYDPMLGVVKVDDVPVGNFNLQFLRNSFGVIAEEPVMFSTTIRENIRLGNVDASESEIISAARMANCYDFIAKFPRAFETLVGTGGAELTNGQKQRIAIARAILQNPQMWLLYKPTAHLDITSEKLVQAALDKACQGKTTIVVPYRLSAIINADNIIYLNQGSIVEQGTHSELMAKGGRYSELAVQSQKEEQEAQMNHPKTKKIVQTIEVEVERDDDDIENEVPEKDKLEPGERLAGPTVVSQIRQKFIASLQMIRWSSPDWPYIFGGFAAAVLNGATLPLFAIFFGDFFAIFELPNEDYMVDDIKQIGLLFGGLGLAACVASFLQTTLLSKSGTLLTTRLRIKCLEAILRQDIGWFDQPENSKDKLMDRLANDCANVQAATANRVGGIFQGFSILVMGFAIGFYFSQDLTWIVGGCVPLVVITMLVDAKYAELTEVWEEKKFARAGAIANEAISNIRIVASMSIEGPVMEIYTSELENLEWAVALRLALRGFLYGLSLAVPIVVYGIVMYYGAQKVTEGLHYQDVIK